MIPRANLTLEKREKRPKRGGGEKINEEKEGKDQIK